MDAALLASMLPIEAIKSADQSVTNSTTLTNDTELKLPVVSGATYRGELVLYYVAPTGNDLDYAWSVPTDSGGRRGMIGPDPTTGAVVDLSAMQSRVSGAFNTEFTLGGAGGSHKVAFERFLLVAGGDGNITLQFAENTAGAGTSATVLTNSHLVLKRVS
ncbi:hypothetical protein AB0K34_10960 [Actinomadura sp. NPDC049382]|uniref:hypothetical protein n=1 Tax=Actinomadura sp. NPDC049382 TaxID=3158220 RepID=UPI0034419B0F